MFFMTVSSLGARDVAGADEHSKAGASAAPDRAGRSARPFP
jgi:hypothetical protein